MDRIRKEILFDQESMDYLKEYQKKLKISNTSAAVRTIIMEHQKREKKDLDDLNKTLTRIRLGSNNADRNSEVILLLLNSLLAYSGMKSLAPQETPQLMEAKKIVQKRIEGFRTRKLERKKKTQKK